MVAATIDRSHNDSVHSETARGARARPRRVTVYLPPGYDAARAQPYPLLLALDGQTMPQWRLAETLDELVGAGAIEPVVVAAVPASARAHG
jgi:enterochelin esterase-like enzyme